MLAASLCLARWLLKASSVCLLGLVPAGGVFAAATVVLLSIDGLGVRTVPTTTAGAGCCCFAWLVIHTNHSNL